MFIQGLSVTYLFSFTMVNKLTYTYLRAELGLVVSIGTSTQALILLILIGIESSLASLFFMVTFFETVGVQLAFGYYNMRQGRHKKPGDVRLDMMNIDPDIISNYIQMKPGN